MATLQDYLNLISQYESPAGNVVNYKFAQDPAKYSAQGYYQITNTNWLQYAPAVGIDTSVYPTAMAAPQDLQAQVAAYLLTQTPAGIGNWASFNPRLASALSAQGLPTYGPPQTNGSVSDATPLIDVSGDAAATPTPSLLDSVDLSQVGISVDWSSPATAIALAAGAAALAFFAFGR